MSIGCGVYARTLRSSMAGDTIPTSSLDTLAIQGLKQLRVGVAAGWAGVEHNAHRRTQMPDNFVVKTGCRRITRKISAGGRLAVYENDYTQAEAAK